MPVQQRLAAEEQVNLEHLPGGLVDDLPVDVEVDVARIVLDGINGLGAHGAPQIADAGRLQMELQRRVGEDRAAAHPVVEKAQRAGVQHGPVPAADRALLSSRPAGWILATIRIG